MDNGSDLISAREAATLLGVSEAALSSQRSRGKGAPYIRREDGSIRYRRSAVLTYQASKQSWHHTAEGREAATRRGQLGGHASWGNRESITRTCDHCGDRYDTKSGISRYCSTTCRVNAKHHAYDEQIPCPICAGPFWQNRSKRKPATCSKHCGIAWRSQRTRHRRATSHVP